MNTAFSAQPPLTVDDPRLTALAFGEIADAALARALSEQVAADPALQRAFDETRAVAAMLEQAFRAEAASAMCGGVGVAPEPGAFRGAPHAEDTDRIVCATQVEGTDRIVCATHAEDTDRIVCATQVAQHKRPSSGGGFSIAPRPEAKDSRLKNVIHFVFWSGASLAACLTFYLMATSGEHTPSQKKLPAETARTDGVRVRLPDTTGTPETGATATRSMSPRTSTALAVKAPTTTADSDLGTWAARQPALRRGQENPFVAVAATGGASRQRPDGRSFYLRGAPLGMTGAGQDYVRRLRGVLATGHLPERKNVRIDGLVNAFLASSTTPVPANPESAAATGVQLFVETVQAPWAGGNWVVRVTVRAGTNTDAPVATDLMGAVDFDGSQIASWRMLGAEDGSERAPELATPATLRSGEMFTSLFEVKPVPGAGNGKITGRLQLDFLDSSGNRRLVVADVPAPVSGGLAAATEDTRFAVAVATLGLAMRKSEYAGTASAAMAQRLASGLNHPNKALFGTLLADAAPLLQ